VAGCTTNPTSGWVIQQARNLSFTGLFERMRFLMHDRDSKFSRFFDEIFRSEGIQLIHTPILAPPSSAPMASPSRIRTQGVWSASLQFCCTSASGARVMPAGRTTTVRVYRKTAWFAWVRCAEDAAEARPWIGSHEVSPAVVSGAPAVEDSPDVVSGVSTAGDSPGAVDGVSAEACGRAADAGRRLWPAAGRRF
jgi:hypothetical protein